MNINKGAQQYAKMNKQTAVEGANPHQLITMLYQGALDSLQQSLGCIERNDIEGRSHHIGRAITILGGLQSFLDHEKGGEISANLDKLYDYMSLRLFEASRDKSREAVLEVIKLLREVKEGWDGIADEAQKIYTQQTDTAKG